MLHSSSHSSPAFEGGLANPVTDAQSAFHAVMHAMANPGRVYALVRAATPPQPLTPELGVIAATLLDHDATVWCDRAIAANADATAWLTFQTGAPQVDGSASAQFALVTDASLLPALAEFSQGQPEFPDRSTTVVLAVKSFESGQGLVLKGPGIDGEREVHIDGLPQDFVAQWRDNGAQFPLGVDLVLVCDDAVIAFPRTTRITKLEG
ncbi:alpha-D-ribose 1-methylphosphonate 5-triphosphate synthase subunit PhnH [Ochrobactrum sp. 19YEA23]|uniref:phosphonate C-P lyase system protein PhnH n=1 Tax=Ochrobactrum sp. 19YEA23 TaxID=3039854 RepID=UPI00247A5F7E|nr:alpha-D-ribose 1-methylphosphonate 5-triphosphate synthase subunit PhnH [Ochrobactrum sp. 19YEA23]